MNNAPILKLKNIAKSYQDGERETVVLRHIDFEVQAAEKIAIVGQSGSGKSTLLHIMAGLDQPTTGEIFWLSENLATLSEKARAKLRNSAFGFVYQFHHLLAECTAIENVMMPLWIRGERGKKSRQEASELLKKLGLSDRANHLPSALSGGERARVAIARSVIHRPKCVFADEPTGNLDPEYAGEAFKLFESHCKSVEAALVLVTHDQALAQKADKTYHLQAHQLETRVP